MEILGNILVGLLALALVVMFIGIAAIVLSIAWSYWEDILNP